LNAASADIFIPEKVKQDFAKQPVQDFNNLPLARPDQQPEELLPGVYCRFRSLEAKYAYSTSRLLLVVGCKLKDEIYLLFG